MSRQKNDGRGRLGGRAKGTRNRPKESVVCWARKIVDANRSRIEERMKAALTDNDNTLCAALLMIAAMDDNDLNEKQYE